LADSRQAQQSPGFNCLQALTSAYPLLRVRESQVSTEEKMRKISWAGRTVMAAAAVALLSLGADISTARAQSAGLPPLDIVFVIDNTGDLYGELPAIKADVGAFMNSFAPETDVQFGVVTFNDPSTDFLTDLTDASLANSALGSITTGGGGDCEEYAITGLSTAADGTTWWQDSERVIFLITSADAKDVDDPASNLTDTIATLQADGITVNTVTYISGCNYPGYKNIYTGHAAPFQVYQDIADATGGVEQHFLFWDDDLLAVMNTMMDRDEDGVRWDQDNCPALSNPDQIDVNEDGFGDACVDPSVDIPDNATVDATATIGTDSQLSQDVIIEAGGEIGDGVVLNKDTLVGEDTLVSDDAVLNQGVEIGAGVIIGANVNIGKGTVIEDLVTIGDDTQIGRDNWIRVGAEVGANVITGRQVTIHPDTEVPDWTTIGKEEEVGTPPAP
jgi:carbonic anhydrase/acetyltransferase-like protein (isoleucine patch superfamily)